MGPRLPRFPGLYTELECAELQSTSGVWSSRWLDTEMVSLLVRLLDEVPKGRGGGVEGWGGGSIHSPGKAGPTTVDCGPACLFLTAYGNSEFTPSPSANSVLRQLQVPTLPSSSPWLNQGSMWWPPRQPACSHSHPTQVMPGQLFSYLTPFSSLYAPLSTCEPPWDQLRGTWDSSA